MNLSLSGSSVFLSPLGLCCPILPSQGLLVIHSVSLNRELTDLAGLSGQQALSTSASSALG